MSYAGDQSTVENSALLTSFAPSPHAQPVDPLLPTTQPSSLTKSLVSTPLSAGGFDVPASAEADGVAKNLSGVYNPFDLDGK